MNAPDPDFQLRPIRRALISVYDKTGLIPFARMLAARGVEILSTGGTARALREAGLAVVEVSDYTDFPEMLDGRVKTLHPKIHGGLLGKREDAAHQNAMREHNIGPIDLVAVTLYPFEETVAKGASQEACIEQIDIGGPSMIRSAAKNHRDVAVVTDIADYVAVEEELAEHHGHTTLALRRMLAARAFARTASYDAAIQHWCWQQGFTDVEDANFPKTFLLGAQRQQSLRYGENPHQQAAFYRTGPVAVGLAAARQLQGKELSYNNLLDADAAWQLIGEFSGGDPALAIIKHANPCGVGVAHTLADAFRKALASDPVSAFGGIIAVNRPLDAATVEAIGPLFLEIILAPAVDEDAKALLAKKKNLRVLEMGARALQEGWTLRSIAGGLLLQEPDKGVLEESELKVVSNRIPTAQEMQDMRFAFTVAKHVKSNAIVLAREESIVGIGAGQMSRVDSTRIACWKAAEAELETRGAVLASDAFFPFSDNVEAAAQAGITAVIQPGGSVRDAEVIAAANAHHMAMVMTGVRHFRH